MLMIPVVEPTGVGYSRRRHSSSVLVRRRLEDVRMLVMTGRGELMRRMRQVKVIVARGGGAGVRLVAAVDGTLDGGDRVRPRDRIVAGRLERRRRTVVGGLQRLVRRRAAGRGVLHQMWRRRGARKARRRGGAVPGTGDVLWRRR